MCSQAQSKLHIKLNPKRLYGSELPCVHELVKIAKLICQASQINMSTAVSIPNDDKNAPEMKDSRLLASEITQNGAELADALGNERELRGLRAQALLVPMESDLAEAVLRQRLKEAKEQIKDLEQKKIERAQDKETLTDRITKKKEELERSKNRLQALRAMRFNFIILFFLVYEMIYILIIFISLSFNNIPFAFFFLSFSLFITFLLTSLFFFSFLPSLSFLLFLSILPSL